MQDKNVTHATHCFRYLQLWDALKNQCISEQQVATLPSFEYKVLLTQHTKGTEL